MARLMYLSVRIAANWSEEGDELFLIGLEEAMTFAEGSTAEQIDRTGAKLRRLHEEAGVRLEQQIVEAHEAAESAGGSDDER